MEILLTVSTPKRASMAVIFSGHPMDTQLLSVHCRCRNPKLLVSFFVFETCADAIRKVMWESGMRIYEGQGRQDKPGCMAAALKEGESRSEAHRE
jgi:hypothetical protein